MEEEKNVVLYNVSHTGDIFINISGIKERIIELQEENKQLNKDNFKLQARADKYKCRNDKAIEYIKENMKLDENSLIYVYEFDERKELLEILKGGNNGETE